MATKEQTKARESIPTDKRVAMALEGIHDTTSRALVILEALAAPILAELAKREARNAEERARDAAANPPVS